MAIVKILFKLALVNEGRQISDDSLLTPTKFITPLIIVLFNY